MQGGWQGGPSGGGSAQRQRSMTAVNVSAQQQFSAAAQASSCQRLRRQTALQAASPSAARLAADGARGVVALQDGLAARQAVEVLAGGGHAGLAVIARRPAAVAAQGAAVLHCGAGAGVSGARAAGGDRGGGGGGSRALPRLALHQAPPAAAAPSCSCGFQTS